MRAFRILNIAILSILIGGSAALYAQDDKSQEDKAPRQEEPKPQPKPDETKPQDEPRPAHPDEAKPAKPEPRSEDRQEAGRGEAKPEEHAQAEHAQGEHGQPSGKGGHIPDDKFRAHFGRSHTFTAKTVIVEGRPQFQYGGYSFQLVDVWPAGWAYTDDCYIDYIDGEYFLFDLLHPGVRIAVFVVM